MTRDSAKRRLSLHPLPAEQALAAFLAVKPPPRPRPKAKKKPAEKARRAKKRPK